MQPQRIGLIALLTVLAILTIDNFQLLQNPKSKSQNSQVLAQTPDAQKAEADRLLNQGIELFNTSQFEAALQSVQQSLKMYQDIGDRASAGGSTMMIGRLYSALGQYPQSLDSYQRALPIFKEIGDRLGEGIILDNIGTVHMKKGQYAKGFEFRQQALAIFREIGNQAHEATTLNNIATEYRVLGQYSQALKLSQQALTITRQVGNRSLEGIILDNIGFIYFNLGQYAKALEVRQQALAIFKNLGARVDEAAVLSNIGMIYSTLRQYPQSLEFYQQALAIFRNVGDNAGEAVALSNIGSVHHDLKQYAQALELYEQALVIVKQLGNKEGESYTLNAIGQTYHDLGQYADASKTLFAAIEAQESLRLGLKDADKVSIFETQASTYRLLQKALIAQNQTDTALEVAERGRARAFVELLRQRLEPKLTEQAADTLPNIEQIKQIAKAQNSTLVQYSIIDDFKVGDTQRGKESELYIWVIKPTGEIAFRQVNLKSLNTSLEDLVLISRDSIGVRDLPIIGLRPRSGTKPKQETNITEQLKQLHKLLIEPIANLLPTDVGSRVVFIPQGSLFLAPFPALQDTDGKYLIEKHTILTAPSIQVLQLTHEQRQRLRANSRSPLQGNNAIIVGNPTMPSLPPALGEKPQQLPSLPGAETEANAIAPLLHTKPFIGNLATKSAIVQLLPKARIIHLATHGLLDDVRGLGSAIALAPDPSSSYKEKLGEINGLLTAEEILDMKLNAELVVLSACNTGRGRITGDGVIGLSRSLISAGVPSIMVSLWSVPDAPTASLMTEFYRNLQQNPDKAQALRTAMLTIMKQHPEPKNWAAFTLIGEAE